MDTIVRIGERSIGPGRKPFIIAELSGNHKGSIDRVKALMDAAKEAEVDAVKLQTYTADALTLPVKTPLFLQDKGLWKGKYLYDLYTEGATPREWHAELKTYAENLGLVFFSTPFDEPAVDFLEELDIPLYKIGSHEVVHIPLLERIGKTQKPVILSTGMATEPEIELAVETLRNTGTTELFLLKCISSYPADPKQFNLRSMLRLQERFGCPVGISDHSLSHEMVLGAIALGGCIIEKHLTLEDSKDALDDGFSLKPSDFKEMVKCVRRLHAGLGKDTIGPCEQEKIEMRFRRSIFASQPIREGDIFTQENIKVVRPGNGLEPKHWSAVLGSKATRDLSPGDPLQQDHVNVPLECCEQ